MSKYVCCPKCGQFYHSEHPLLHAQVCKGTK